MYLIKINTEVDKLIVNNNCLYTFCFRFDITVQNTTAITRCIIEKLIPQSATEFYEPKG